MLQINYFLFCKEMDNIIQKIKTDELTNHVLFTLARTNYLKTGEEKGSIIVDIDDLDIETISLFEKICYVTNQNLDYNPQTQFIVVFKTETSTFKHCFDSIRKRSIFFVRVFTFGNYDVDTAYHTMYCPNCDEQQLRKLTNFSSTNPCNRCSNQVNVIRILECSMCCTQLIYII